MSRTVVEGPAKPPSLTDVQKLQLLNASKDVELLELRLQHARETLQRMVTIMTPPGYRMTDKLELVKLPEKEAK